MERKTEHPILFSTPMVKAILEGRKTMTRRMKGLEHFNRKPDDYHFFKDASGGINWNHLDYLEEGGAIKFRAQIGDKLWVRETFEHGCMGGYIYKADRSLLELGQYFMYGYKWKSSRFMPKAAARIWLEITNFRIERLNNISEEDSINEGITYPFGFDPDEDSPSLMFQLLWEEINGSGSWDANPWVWVIEFKRIDPC